MSIEMSRRDVVVLRALAVAACCLVIAPQISVAELSAASLGTPSSLGDPEQRGVAGSCIRMVGGLFLCLGLFAAGIHMYRRYVAKHGIGGKRRLTIRERLPISPKASLLVVALDGKEFLVSTGSDRVTVIPSHALAVNDFSDSFTEACEDSEAFNA